MKLRNLAKTRWDIAIYIQILLTKKKMQWKDQSFVDGGLYNVS
jgi:hypothetical protein